MNDANLEFEKLNKFLILENIDENEDRSKIELYVNYLVESENKIVSLEGFQNNFLVNFENEIDFESVCMKLK
jgi:hypothetical protein